MKEIVNKHKAPKDTVLNNIMKEIDEENGVVVDALTEEILPKKKKEKKRSWLSIFTSILILVLVVLVLFVVYITVEATAKKENPTHSSSTIPKVIVVPIQVANSIEKTILTKKLVELKKIEIPKNKMQKPIKSKASHSNKEYERKSAKAALMEQMKN